ncbi:hypothetical protein Aph02nite_57240 [Actinoplanes philippinensis]|uniref:Arginase family enzyme n=1 Tax=Actinoplanes philippinensis TaxID=35752 RepID=A0A1I2J0N5_9ACTN|nr:hypothetical protein Aph02nite_57240 [Actinoplanes philippinensis]SFF47578.1 Arginase family enzyme [Actinoplanes philippinensis]
MRRIAVLDAPSNLGLRPPTATSVPGCAKAPGALRDQGLLTKLGARDAGCLTPPRYDPGDWRPGDGVAHAAEIAAYSRALADRIGAIIDGGEFPVVLGGDCSILIGSGIAMHRLGDAVGGRIGLVFVDGHSDFRHPGNASYVGAAAGEDLALVTGRGQADLAAIESRRPYFRDIDVVVLGIRAQDEYRLDLQAAGIVTRPVPALRAEGAARSAQWARDQLVDCAGYWVHVDVDVLDPAVMPAVDAPDPGGIAFPELELLLTGLVESPHCLGVEITVFDPDYDPDGRYASEITSAVVSGLSPVRTTPLRPDLAAARRDLDKPSSRPADRLSRPSDRLSPSAGRLSRPAASGGPAATTSSAGSAATAPSTDLAASASSADLAASASSIGPAASASSAGLAALDASPNSASAAGALSAESAHGSVLAAPFAERTITDGHSTSGTAATDPDDGPDPFAATASDIAPPFSAGTDLDASDEISIDHTAPVTRISIEIQRSTAPAAPDSIAVPVPDLVHAAATDAAPPDSDRDDVTSETASGVAPGSDVADGTPEAFSEVVSDSDLVGATSEASSEVVPDAAHTNADAAVLPDSDAVAEMPDDASAVAAIPDSNGTDPAPDAARADSDGTAPVLDGVLSDAVSEPFPAGRGVVAALLSGRGGARPDDPRVADADSETDDSERDADRAASAGSAGSAAPGIEPASTAEVPDSREETVAAGVTTAVEEGAEPVGRGLSGYTRSDADFVLAVALATGHAPVPPTSAAVQVPPDDLDDADATATEQPTVSPDETPAGSVNGSRAAQRSRNDAGNRFTNRLSRTLSSDVIPSTSAEGANSVTGGEGDSISGGEGHFVSGGGGDSVTGGEGDSVSGGEGDSVSGGEGDSVSGGGDNSVTDGGGNLFGDEASLADAETDAVGTGPAGVDSELETATEADAEPLPEPTGSEPPGVETSGIETSGDEPTCIETSGGEPTGGEPTGSEPTGSEPTGSEPTGSEQAGSEPTPAEPAHTEAARAEPARVEAERGEVRLLSRPLGSAPLLDSEPLPATRPGMLRPRPPVDGSLGPSAAGPGSLTGFPPGVA